VNLMGTGDSARSGLHAGRSISRLRIAARAAILILALAPPAAASAQCPAPRALVIQVGSSGVGFLAAVDPDSGRSTPLTGAFQNAQFVALDAAGTTAWVTDAPGGTLSRVDLATGGIRVAAFSLGSPRGVALTPDGTRAYVAEWAGGDLVSVDLATGEVEQVAAGLPGPIGLALDAAGTTAYVTAGGLYRVDLLSGTVTSLSLAPDPGPGMLGVALDATESFAYVTIPNSGELVEVDLAGGAVRTVATGLNVPFGVVLDPSGRNAFVADPFGFRLWSVDLRTGETTVAAAGLSAVGAVLNGAGTEALVSGGATLSSVDLATGAVGTLAVGLISPQGLALDPAERNVYLAEYGRLRRYDRATATLVTVAAGFHGLRGVAVDPSGTKAYVTEEDRLMAVDLQGGASTTVAAALFSPGGVAVGPGGDIAYVTEEDEDSSVGRLSSVVLATGETDPLATGLFRPRAVALRPAGDAAYVTGQGTLWEVDLPSGSSRALASSLDSPSGRVTGVALDPSQGRAFITESGIGRLSSVDLVTGAVTPVANGLQQPAAVAFASAGPSPDLPPVAVPSVRAVIECTSPAGAAVDLDGSASYDPDSSRGTSDDIASYEWFERFGQTGEVFLGRGPLLEKILPLGSHEITLVVTDRCGRSDHLSTRTMVEDTTPPRITLSRTPSILWPPNHRMVDVLVSGGAADECGAASLVLESVTSSEPDDVEGGGDGATPQDIRGASPGSADFSFQLRSERESQGPGRTYTAVYRAADASGNEGRAVLTLLVPHDMDGVEEPLAIRVDQSPEGTVLEWGAVPGASTYDVARGRVSDLGESSDSFSLGALTFLARATQRTTTLGSEDREVPAVGEAFFYLVEYRGETTSGFGTASAAKPRLGEETLATGSRGGRAATR
jgi:DNA-binding beta-propeller fold protein YncE